MATKLSRVPLIGALSMGALWLPASASAQQPSPIAAQIAKTYGIDSWDQVEAIRFTFHLGDKLSRSWVWEPKVNSISYDGPDKDGKPVQITYSRAGLASQSAFVKEELDPAFNNDQYALLLPLLHFAWDTAVTVEEAGKAKLPLGKGSARKVFVNYPAQGGYTPGDIWELYIGKDGRLEEIVLRHAAPLKPSVTLATWAGHKQAGPLLVSVEKRGTADGQPIHIFFTKVAVKLAGTAIWVDAR